MVNQMSASSYSVLAEKELFELLTHVCSGASIDHKSKRVGGLEELETRIVSDSIRDKNEAIGILLDMAETQGTNLPESALVVECLRLMIEKHEEAFQTIMGRLEGRENRFFICLSKLVLSLDREKRSERLVLWSIS